MKGLELAEKYYEAFGAPMIREQFLGIESLIAAGLTGSGSECYGFDDAVSGDHDWEPGFCLFLPEEELVDRRTAFLLERAYARLPAEFEGYARQKMGPAGGQRRGVFRREDYFREKLGCLPETMTAQDWLRLPDWALAEAVNGRIFRDDAGEMTRDREILRNMPEDLRRTVQLQAVPAARRNGRGAAGGRRVCQPRDVYGVPAGEAVQAVLQVEFPGAESAAGRGRSRAVAGVAADDRERRRPCGRQILLHGRHRVGND